VAWSDRWFYTKGAVRSADGTSIGYRQLGHGPAVVLVHGGMQASQDFMKLTTELSGKLHRLRT
jgi:pimeloyl-ACP methyl ester carboxylesterase